MIKKAKERKGKDIVFCGIILAALFCLHYGLVASLARGLCPCLPPPLRVAFQLSFTLNHHTRLTPTHPSFTTGRIHLD